MEVFKKLQNVLGLYSIKLNGVLKDGTEVIFDNLEVGVEVYIQTEDGNKPLPDGEYELEDGFKIVVKDGLISEIIEPTEEVIEEPEPAEEPVEAADEPVEDAPEEPVDEPAVEVSIEDQVAELFVKVTALEEALATIMTSQEEMSKENDELKKTKEEFTSQIEKLETTINEMDGAGPLKKRKVEDGDNSFKISSATSYKLKAMGLKK